MIPTQVLTEAAEDMLEEGPGHGVQQTSTRQHEIHRGLCKSDIKYTLERKLELLNDIRKITENMSMNMDEFLQWDKGSVFVDLLWKLFQFGSIYLLGKLGFSFWVILLGLCMVLTASAWAKKATKSTKCTIIDPTHNESKSLEDLPVWVTYPDMQRAEWVNRIIARVWPRVEVWLTSALANIEHKAEVVETIHKMGCTGIKFNKVKLGSVPVRVGGVKIHSENRTEVVMDVNFTYYGDCDVELTLEMPSPASPLVSSLRNVSFEGLLRIQMNPLIKNPPLVGGLRISLLSRPILDFELGGVAGILELPGLQQIVRYLLLDQIERALVTPNSQYLSISEEVSMFCEMTRSLDEPEGVLCLTLVEAKQLVNKDSQILGQGVSDPYTNIDFTADRLLQRFKSPCIKDDLNPVWNFLCQVPVDDLRSVSDITLTLFDKDKYTKDDPLGDCTLPKSVVKRAAETGQDQDFWKLLDNTKTGSVRTRISWSTLSMNPMNQKDDQALVVVFIDSCKSIFKGNENKPDVIVSVTLNSVTKVSSKAFGSCDPIFEDRMLLLANNPTVDDVKIDVIDIKSDKVAGSLCVELTQLLSQDSFCMMNQTFDLYSKNKALKGSITLSMSLRYLSHSEAVVKSLSQGLNEKKSPSFMISGEKEDSAESIFAVNEPVNQEEEVNGVSNLQMDHAVHGKTPDISEKEPAFLSIYKNESEERVNGYAIRKEPDHIKDLKASMKNIHELLNGNEVYPKPMHDKPRLTSSKNGTSLPNGSENQGKPGKPNGNTNQTLSRQGTVRKRHHSRAANKKDSRPKVHLTLKFNKATSVISVIVHKVINLQETSHTALPNPYVKTYLIEAMFASNKRDNYSKKKTKTKKNCVNPIFEDTLEYFVPYYNLKHHRIEVSFLYYYHIIAIFIFILQVNVCSRRTLVSKVASLGRCLVDLGGLDQSLSHTDWYLLRESVEGALPASYSGDSLSRTSSSASSSVRRSSLPR